MQTKLKPASPGILLFTIALSIVGLLLDMMFPLGVAGGILQVLPVMFGIWLANRYQFFVLSFLASSFVVVGYFLSPEGGVFWVVMLNRLLSLAVVIGCAVLIYSYVFSGRQKVDTPVAPIPVAESDEVNRGRIISPGMLMVGLAALLMVVLAMFQINKEMSESQQWVAHTHEVKTHISEVLSMMQDMETGQRGYLLTGREHYLQPFESAVTGVDQEIDTLRWLTTDNPRQQQRAEQLVELVANKVDELEQTIALRRNEGLESALEVVRSDYGKEMMDQIRRVLAEMNSEEDALMVEREDSSDTLYYLSIFIYGMAVVMVTVLAATIIQRIGLFVAYQKRSEQHLRQLKEEAEEANQSKSMFLSAMSHELRTPLNAILGFGQLLDSSSNPLDKSQRESVAHILASGNHLLILINEILDLAKIESGTLDLSIEGISLKSVVTPSYAMAKELGNKYGIEVVNRISPDKEIFLKGDLTRVRQVLINLLSNAVKYNRPEGSVYLDCQPSNGRVRIAVSDTGYGIPEEMMASLFKPFERLEGSSGIEGTGIGLTITKQLLEMMGGELGVESRVGEGSTFWFELPLSTASEVVMPADEIGSAHDLLEGLQQQSGHRARVVYVEDNPANVDLMSLIFKRMDNLTLEVYETAEDGVDAIKQSPPDLVLMDVNLPGMSGLEASRILKTHPATTSIPILGVSANAMQGDLENASESGIDRYITKPFQVTEVISAITHILSQRVVDAGVVDEGAVPVAAPVGEWDKQLSEKIVTSILATNKIAPEYHKVLEKMFAAIPEIVGELKAALSGDTAKEVERAAHRIKTNSATLGADELAKIAQTVETLAAGGELDKIPTHLDQMEEEYQKVLPPVNALLAHLKSTVSA